MAPELIGATIIDGVLHRRGRIISISDDGASVFVQWDAKHASTVILEPHRFSIITRAVS